MTDSPHYQEQAADLWDLLLRVLDRRGIGRNPTDAQLVDVATWMHAVLDALADCGYGIARVTTVDSDIS